MTMKRAEAGMPSRGFPRASILVLVIALAAGVAMLSGLAGGLVRIGWPLLPEHFVAPVALHSALMVCGFFGFGIALERAAALKQPIAFAAPALAACGTGAALALQPGLAGIFWLLAALALVAVYAEVLRRAPELHTAVEAAGALAWAGGTLWWLLARPFSVVVAWWAAFLVLTIFGERRELARFVPLSEKARRGYIAMVVVQVGALVVLAVPWHEHPIAGGLWWLSMSLFSGWLLRYDLACRPRVHRFGWALHTARSLRLGYTWLMLAGLWGVVNALRGMPLDSPGPLHMLLLGFVFSMVFGHAPIMLPALLRTPISPPGPFAFVPVGLMTLGVTLRAVGDAIGSGGVRAGAGALQAAAILTFAFTMIRHLRR
jgi:hypothetical protein